MTNYIATSLSKIKNTLPGINATTDKAAEAMRRLEEFLNENGAGGGGDTFFGKNEDSDVKLYSIAYARGDAGRYEFMVHRYGPLANKYDGRGPLLETWPWHSAPRELKLISLDAVPDLLTEIAEQAEGLAINANEAVDGVLNELDAAAGSGRKD